MIGSRRAWNNIDLICSAGLDIATLTPLLCQHIRHFIGAAATAIFWMDEFGMPVGFHHEDSPASARDLFVNEFERLFVGPSEINVAMLAQCGGKAVGTLFAPPSEYFTSNTFNLLVRPSGHHHALDLRVAIDGRVRVIVLLFREQSNRFSASDAERLRSLQSCLLKALGKPQMSDWTSNGEKGQMLLDTDGQTLLFLNDAAEILLKSCTLVGQCISLTGPIVTAPLFIRQLCLSGEGVRQISLSIPSGRLVATATALRSSTGVGADGPVLVTLERQVATVVDILDGLFATPLSPAQRKIALGAARGLRRAAIGAQLGIGSEAMKKHMAAIYATFDVNSWEDLRMIMQQRTAAF